MKRYLGLVISAVFLSMATTFVGFAPEAAEIRVPLDGALKSQNGQQGGGSSVRAQEELMVA